MVLGDPIDCKLNDGRRLDLHISVVRLKLTLMESKKEIGSAFCVLQSCESNKRRVLQAFRDSSVYSCRVEIEKKSCFEVDEAKRDNRKVEER